ncbi:MAG TPA: SDR family oxidoreductase [Candidatus Binataceae bacterium]|nr:SDR family oxidoreductase [Candidatus Binataceae bacterium]
MPITEKGSSLSGRVALVTGVSRRVGIGFAIAKRLAERGANLFIQAWPRFDAAQPYGADPVGTAALAAHLRRIGTRVEFLEADFADPDAPRQVINSAEATLGGVDILIANHAYSTMGALQELTAENIDAHLVVNVRATLLLIRYFAAQHTGRPGGRIIMMTSGQHLGPMPEELAYIASKGALHQLTRSLSDHLIRRGITVNTVNPGATDTGYATPAVLEAVRKREPQGRWGQPDDVARLIAWLASDEARWITGEVINSTGGGP